MTTPLTPDRLAFPQQIWRVLPAPDATWLVVELRARQQQQAQWQVVHLAPLHTQGAPIPAPADALYLLAGVAANTLLLHRLRTPELPEVAALLALDLSGRQRWALENGQLMEVASNGLLLSVLDRDKQTQIWLDAESGKPVVEAAENTAAAILAAPLNLQPSDTHWPWVSQRVADHTGETPVHSLDILQPDAAHTVIAAHFQLAPGHYRIELLVIRDRQLIFRDVLAADAHGLAQQTFSAIGQRVVYVREKTELSVLQLLP